MATINWDEITTFDRYPKLDMKVGDKVTVTFEDDGSFVSKKVLADSGAQYPRDSFVFVISKDGQKHEFWVGAKNYSLMNILKQLREENGGNLKGLTVEIERISDKPSETNYKITKK